MTDTTKETRPRPVVLCVLDGWGLAPADAHNAISLAATPVWDELVAHAPSSRLETSGLAVGLPEGQMGNSEVGHMNIGGGRVVMQDLPRIDAAIEDGSLAGNPELLRIAASVEDTGGRCHIMGLMSPGGVHSHQRHIATLANFLARRGIQICVHAFLDGRDTPPKSADGYLRSFLDDIAASREAGAPIHVATVSGRYFAMDRDRNWDRVEKAFKAIVSGDGAHAGDAAAAIDLAYARGETDEFVTPTVIGDYGGFCEGDGLVMANFRADRAREILTSIVDPDFDGFTRDPMPKLAAAAGMVSYSEELDARLPALFPPLAVKNTLGEVAAKADLKQLRIAETEKYAHVTFFLNGGEEKVLPGEDRILVPSPKVATYDLKPEMSAPEVTNKLVEAVKGGRYDLIVVNYANPDMVGHTGDLAAAVRAVECIDVCLGRLCDAVESAGGALLITADHGNVEQMQDPASGGSHTAHTTNEVPFVLAVAPERQRFALSDGRLADIAPTVLTLMNVDQPEEMTGHSLLTAHAVETRSRASA